jgi:hypothetical protein
MKGVFMDKFNYSKKKRRNSMHIAYITAVCRWPAAPVYFEIFYCASNLRTTEINFLLLETRNTMLIINLKL